MMRYLYPTARHFYVALGYADDWDSIDGYMYVYRIRGGNRYLKVTRDELVDLGKRIAAAKEEGRDVEDVLDDWYVCAGREMSLDEVWSYCDKLDALAYVAEYARREPQEVCEWYKRKRDDVQAIVAEFNEYKKLRASEYVDAIEEITNEGR